MSDRLSGLYVQAHSPFAVRLELALRIDVDGSSEVDDLAQQSKRDPPVALVGIALYGRGLLVDTHDGADALVQVLVGKGHRVADHEVFTLSTGRRRWRWVVWCRRGCSGGIGDDRGIGQRPAPARSDILDQGLGLSEFEDAALPHRLGQIVGDVADCHADMQLPAALQDSLGIVKHPPDGQIQAVQVGARGEAQCVKNVHDAQFTG